MNETSTSIKYAIHTINKKFQFNSDFILDANTYVTATNPLLSVLGGHEVEQWKKWFGTLKIDSLDSSPAYIVSWIDSAHTKIINKENYEVSHRLWYSHVALLLTAYNLSEQGESSIYTGEGILNIEGKVIPTGISTITNKPNLLRCYYQRNLAFLNDNTLPSDLNRTKEIFTEWQKLDQAFLDAKKNGRFCLALSASLESLIDGRITRSAATAIARFVEAAEAIIGLPNPGGGNRVFAERALNFVENFKDHPFLRWNQFQLKEHLIKLYKIRNTRNHGIDMKDNIISVYQLDKNAPDLDEKIELLLQKAFFLAETLAKETIKYVLFNPDKLDLMKERALLEGAWDKKTFIPHKNFVID